MPTVRIHSRILLRCQTLIEMVSIFAISSGLTYTLGRMTGSSAMDGRFGRDGRSFPCRRNYCLLGGSSLAIRCSRG